MDEGRQRQARRQRPARQALVAVTVVAVLAAAVGIGVFVQSQRSASTDVQPVRVSVGSGKRTVHVYEDFQCPACRQFEQASGSLLRRLARQGQARVVYHPVSVFDGVQQERSLRAGEYESRVEASTSKVVSSGKVSTAPAVYVGGEKIPPPARPGAGPVEAAHPVRGAVSPPARVG